MPISIRGTSLSSFANNGANATLNLSGLSLQENDVVLISCAAPRITGNTPAVVSAGWTQVATPHLGSTTNRPSIGVWYKRMGATPDSSVEVSGDGSGNTDTTIIGIAFSGVDTTTALDQTTTTAGETLSTNPNPASIVTQTNGAEVVVFACGQVNDGTVVAPSGYSNGISIVGNDTVDHTHALASKNVATAGTEDPPPWTTWSSSYWYTYTVALKPAPAAQNINLNQSLESDSTQAVSIQKKVSIAQTIETNLSQGVALGSGATEINVTQVTETEVAQALVGQKRVNVGQAGGSGGGLPLPDTDLVWYVDDDDLSDGAISSWTDRQLTGEDPAQTTEANKPNKNSSGVNFDGNDWLADTSQALNIGASYSLVLVANFVEVASSSGIWLGIHDGTRNFTIGTRHDGSNQKAVGYYYDGSSTFNFDKIISDSDLHCVVVTRSLANGLKMYVDGLEVTADSAYLGIGQDSNSLTIGTYGGGFAVVPANSIGRLFAIYNTELSQSDVDEIYASLPITSKLGFGGSGGISDTAQPITVKKNVNIVQATETDIAQSITYDSGSQNINAAQASESNIALAIAKSKLKVITQSSETGESFAVAVKKNLPIVQTTEADEAQTFSKVKYKAVGQAAESDLSQSLTPRKNKTIAQAEESDIAQTISASRISYVDVNSATEANLSQALGKTKNKAVSQSAETDTSNPATSIKRKAITLVTETDESFTISGELGIETAFETDAAQNVTAQKVIPIIESTETDEAFIIFAVKSISVEQTTEVNTAEALSIQKRKSLSTSSNYEIYSDPVGGAVVYHFFLEKKTAESYHLVDDMDYLSPDVRNWKIGESVDPSLFVTLPDDGSEYASGIVAENGVGVYSAMDVNIFNANTFIVTETDLVQTISVLKKVSVFQVDETDQANEINLSGKLTQALETDLAQPVVVRKLLSVVTAVETETALSIGRSKSITIQQAGESDSAFVITLMGAPIVLDYAEETDFALGLEKILKRVNISFAEETDISFDITRKPRPRVKKWRTVMRGQSEISYEIWEDVNA